MQPTAATVTALFLLLAIAARADDAGRTINVKDDDALRRVMKDARPGDRIAIAPGTYRPGLWFANLRGAEQNPIVIEAADPKNKPLFRGGALGLHLADPSHVVLRNLAFAAQTGNGLNIDDGGTPDTPAHHITLESIDVFEVGPRGNRDGIKLSGIDDLVLKDCTVTGWGGQAVDMVGCHRVRVEGCRFVAKDGFTNSGAVQAKGGSSEVLVRRCDFVGAERAVNIGGSTALAVFRPRDAKYEAKDVTVENCRFAANISPIAFVGVDGAVVRNNTILRPSRWAVRILQETNEPGFVSCRNGRFEQNLIVFRRGDLREVINIGGNTDPKSFVFRRNWWYAADRPNQSRPNLPVPEEGGVYGRDPGVNPDDHGLPAVPTTPEAQKFGAGAPLP